MRRIKPAPRNEEGSALLLALIFLTAMSIVVASTLSLADVDFRNTSNVRDDRRSVYAADAALDAAINAYAATGTCPTPATGAIPEVNGVTPTVSCDTAGGGAVVAPLNQPDLAVSTQAIGVEPGMVIVSGAVSAVRGGVYSSTSINTSSGATLYVAPPDRIVTRAGCTGGGTVGPATCETVTGPYAPGNDPGYGKVASTAPMPFVGAPPCPATEPVVFPTGTYNNRPALESFMTTCARRTYWFPAAGGVGSPGVYHFDFPDDSAWTIPSGYTIVGGTFPAGVTGDTVASKPAGQRCDDTREGVQFVFSGASRIVVRGAVDLCAPYSDPTTTTPRVAIYGVRTGDPAPPAPSPQTFSAKPSTSPSGSQFSPVTGAYTPNDGSVASAPVPADGTASISMSGFDVSAIPDTAVVNSASLTFRHSEAESPPPKSGNSNYNKLALVATATSGALQASMQSTACGGGAPNCAKSLTTASTLHDDGPTALPAAFLSKSALSGLAVAYKATSTGSAYSASLDGVTLSVTYTEVLPVVARYRSQGGCVTFAPYTPPPDPSADIAASVPCALVTTAGSNASLAVKGTIYAPVSAVDIQLVGTTYQVFGRGLIVRSLRSNVTSSIADCNVVPPPDDDRCFPYQLPRGTVPAAQKVLFTVKVGTTTRLRSLVQFNGAAAPSVQSWTVVNEP